MPRTSKTNVEYRRGLQEAAAAIAALQEHWPAAFPKRSHLVRPLVVKVHEQVAKALGWNTSYARAVLRTWKFRVAYCQAVLAYDRRYDLSGIVSEETVGDEARAQARSWLAHKQAAVERRRATDPDQHLVSGTVK